MVVIYVEGPRGGRLPLREENMIVDYVDTACQELKIKDAEIDVVVYNKFPQIIMEPEDSDINTFL